MTSVARCLSTRDLTVSKSNTGPIQLTNSWLLAHLHLYFEVDIKNNGVSQLSTLILAVFSNVDVIYTPDLKNLFQDSRLKGIIFRSRPQSKPNTETNLQVRWALRSILCSTCCLVLEFWHRTGSLHRRLQLLG